MAEVLSMVRVGACVVRVAVLLAVACIAAQTNVARNAFLNSTIIPQYMTLFEIICPSPILRLTLGLCFNNGLVPTLR